MKIRVPAQFCHKDLYITTIYTYLNQNNYPFKPYYRFLAHFLTNKSILNY